MATIIPISAEPQTDKYIASLGGVSRREFLKFCAGVAATFGLPAGMAWQIAEAAGNPRRPPVIWLSAQECTGCTAGCDTGSQRQRDRKGLACHYRAAGARASNDRSSDRYDHTGLRRRAAPCAYASEGNGG